MASRKAGAIQIQATLQVEGTLDRLQYYDYFKDLQQNSFTNEQSKQGPLKKKLRISRSDFLDSIGCNSVIAHYAHIQGNLIWILQPHNYNCLCEIYKMYKAGVLLKALRKDISNMCQETATNLAKPKFNLLMNEKHVIACMEELAIGEPFMGTVDAEDVLLRASEVQFHQCFAKLLKHCLLITSPHIALYLQDHLPKLRQLGHVAYTQYVTKKSDFKQASNMLGYASPPTECIPGKESLTWLAAYYAIQGEASHKLFSLCYTSVSSFMMDIDFHRYFVKYDEKYLKTWLAKLQLQCLTCHDVNILTDWLASCTLANPSNEGSAHVKTTSCLGRLIAFCCHCIEWSLSNMQLCARDIDGMCAAVGERTREMFQKNITHMVLSFNNLGGAGSCLGRLLLALPILRRLDLSKTGLLAKDIDDMVTIIGDTTLNITELYMFQNNLQGSGSSLGKLLKSVPRNKHLDFSTVNLSATDVTELAEALGHCKLEAESVSLDTIPLSGTGIAVGKMMAAFTEDTHWSLHFTGLEDKDMKQIVQYIHDKHVKVSEISLQGNRLGGAGASAGKFIYSLPHAKVFSLRNNGLEAKDIEHMVHVLTGRDCSVKKIDLSGNNFQGGGLFLGQLMTALTKCNEWDLSFTGLTKQDVSDMSDTLQGKRLHNVVELSLQGNNICGAGLPVGRLMVSLPWCVIWDLSSTRFEPRDFYYLAKAVGHHLLKAETLVLDGTDRADGVGDKEMLSKIMPQCNIRYTGMARGKLDPEMEEVDTPVEDLTVNLNEMLIDDPSCILGLSDHTCLLANRGLVIRLNQDGDFLGRYYADKQDQAIRGLVAYDSMLYMLQERSISQVELPDYCSCSTVEDCTCDNAMYTLYDVPLANLLQAGLALDASTLVLLDFHEGVIQFKPQEDFLQKLADVFEAYAIARHVEGMEATYYISDSEHCIEVYNTSWQHMHTIEFAELPLFLAVTPEHTLLIGCDTVVEYSLEGDLLREVFNGDIEITCMSLQGRHVWLLSNESETLYRYALYQYDFEDDD